MYYLSQQAWSFSRCRVGAAFIRTTLFLLQEGVMAVYSPAMTFFKRDRKMDNHFENKGGEQNVAQGKNPIAKQVNNYGVPPEVFANYVEELGVTKSALTSFFKILEEQQVARGDLDAKLREIAMRHVELLQRFETVTSDDPEVQALKKEAGDAIKSGAYDQADMLLAQAKERDRAAVARLKESLAEQQAALEKRQLSEAASCVEQAKLQRLQYNYEKSARYFQEAATAFPEGYKWERANYLGVAGYDLHHFGEYSEALEYSNQSLILFRAINDRKEEAKLLNNISLIYQAQGAYDHALGSLEQCLPIWQKIGNKQGQGSTLNNIAAIHYSKGEY
ncbi:MAG: hypothetical protein D3904_17790, partial [Candidatus Electrothrix sp. EH2]|nr:hypothetical protein [Candidatus Electrothrix sp. EH2]